MGCCNSIDYSKYDAIFAERVEKYWTKVMSIPYWGSFTYGLVRRPYYNYGSLCKVPLVTTQPDGTVWLRTTLHLNFYRKEHAMENIKSIKYNLDKHAKEYGLSVDFDGLLKPYSTRIPGPEKGTSVDGYCALLGIVFIVPPQ